MNVKHLIITTFLVFMGFLAGAQSQKANYKKYEYGKSLLNNEQYLQSMEVFRSLSAVQQNNSYLEYALYLYGHSAYKAGKKDVAKNALLELVYKFPKWNKIDEAHYLLAVIDFENRNFSQGFEHLKKIRNSSLEDNVQQLIETKVTGLTIESMTFLYENYPYEILGQKIWDKLQTVQVYPTYQELFEGLRPQFGIGDSLAQVVNEKVEFKETYRVAALLPFFNSDININSIERKNQPVLDIYEGMQLAARQLEEEGVDVELFAFDTKRDSLSVVTIMSDPAFKTMDLLVGPLYPNTIPPVADYAGVFRKPMVNPVSSNKKIITGNPFAFLTSPTPETQVKVAVNYTIDSLKTDSALVIHGLKESEYEMAELYKKTFEEQGGEFAHLFPFDFGKKGFEKLLGALDTLAEDSLSHVFVSSDDPVVAVNTVSAMQNLKSEAYIIASSEWLNFNQLTYSQLENMKVHLIYPRYVDTNRPTVRKFTSDFVKKVNLLPSAYAYMGYETMYFFGKMLEKYGTGMPREIHFQEFMRSLLTGFDYEGGNDNQFVPILKFVEGELKITNHPIEDLENEPTVAPENDRE